MPTRILHLSDTHYGKSDKEGENLERIVDKVVADPQNDADLVILITGDLVHDGRKHQFKAAREILDPLFQKFTVWTIPGNHDYGWRGIFAQAKKFKHFKHHFYGIEQITYPHLTTHDGHLFIGLNSLREETDGLDGLLADGELGPDQLDDLGGILDQTMSWPETKKIILHVHHHPFIFPDETLLGRTKEKVGHRLKDGKRLMRLISGRVDLLLFGHDHRHLDFSNSRLSKKYEIPYILAAGKCTETESEYAVDEDGKAIESQELARGLLGRRIEIDDQGKISYQTVDFT